MVLSATRMPAHRSRSMQNLTKLRPIMPAPPSTNTRGLSPDPPPVALMACRWSGAAEEGGLTVRRAVGRSVGAGSIDESK